MCKLEGRGLIYEFTAWGRKSHFQINLHIYLCTLLLHWPTWLTSWRASWSIPGSSCCVCLADWTYLPGNRSTTPVFILAVNQGSYCVTSGEHSGSRLISHLQWFSWGCDQWNDNTFHSVSSPGWETMDKAVVRRRGICWAGYCTVASLSLVGLLFVDLPSLLMQ